jgi:uncharacterized repeat protein (TIGR03803 family)
MKNEKIVLSTIAYCPRLKSFRTRAALMLTTLMLVVAASTAATAQTFKTLHSFDLTDGATPYAGLVQTTNGNLYGVTGNGGATCCGGFGTVFKITPRSKLTTLYSFCSDYPSCPDGAYPYGGLIQATNGSLYGTTAVGGGAKNGAGTVFEIALSGKLTTLHSFNDTDGTNPNAPLVQATNGNLFGTTVGAGANDSGTVFQMTTGGKLTTLYNFCSQSNCTDGAYPSALVQATNGDFYGITVEGGANDVGTVFKITPSGKLTTLHSFDGTDGRNPEAGLTQATNGDLYGTTLYGGANYNEFCGANCGTVFKITPSGTPMVLYSFCSKVNSKGYCTDGRNPEAGLVEATNGDLYGTTPEGGANDYGTVFKITPSGTLTTLHSFDYTDGGFPQAVLAQDTNGTFYGTTSAGGTNGYNVGTVFSLSVGLGPFAETQPTSGKVGAAVNILGTSLTGATSVTFKGTAAVFKVVSASLITTTVPTGATTGTVEVTTPKGTLKSNVPFRVTP